MDLEPGSKNSEKSERVVDGSEGSKHPETSKVVDGSDSSTHLTILPEATANEGGPVPTRRLISISSLSSLASDSSLEDLFQVDTNRITTSTHTASVPKHDDYNIVGPASTSRASDVTHGSMVPGLSPTDSPSIQTMDRCGGYDPYRIPTSVFSTSKSNKEMDWSVASNESLFSIHLGNNSFSRDHTFFLGDLGKSGELYKSGELFSLNPALPALPVPAVEIESERIEEVRKSGVGVADETIKDIARANAEDHSEGRVQPPTVFGKSPSLSRRSDGSGTSTRSFAFPMYVYIHYLRLTDGMKSSVKATEPCLEQPPPQPPVRLSPKKVTKSKVTYWFRCFSWFKWGCSCHRRHCCSYCCCC